MKHLTEVVAYRKLSSGQMAVTVLCCGTYEHVHTVAAAVLAHPDKKKESLAQAHALAARQHQESLDAAVAAEALMGEVHEHDDGE